MSGTEGRKAEGSPTSGNDSSIGIDDSRDTGNSSADWTTTSSRDETVARGTSSSSSPPGDDRPAVDSSVSSRLRDLASPPSDAEFDVSASGCRGGEFQDAEQRVVFINGVDGGTDKGEHAEDRRRPSYDVRDEAAIVTESTDTVEEHHHRCDDSDLSSLSLDELRQLAAELLPVLHSITSSIDRSRGQQESSTADALPNGTVVDVMPPESALVEDVADEKDNGTDLPSEIGEHVNEEETSKEKASCASITMEVTQIQTPDLSTSPRNESTMSVETTTSLMSDNSTLSSVTTEEPISTASSITEPRRRTSGERQPDVVSVSPGVDAIDDEVMVSQSPRCESSHVEEHSADTDSERKSTSNELSVEIDSDTPAEHATPDVTDSHRPAIGTSDGYGSADRCGGASCGTTAKIGDDVLPSDPEVEEDERRSPVGETTAEGVRLDKYQRIAVLMKLQKEMATMQLEMSRLRDAMRSADGLLQKLMDSEFDES